MGTDDRNDIYFAISELRGANEQILSVSHSQNKYELYEKRKIIIKRAEKAYNNLEKD